MTVSNGIIVYIVANTRFLGKIKMSFRNTLKISGPMIDPWGTTLNILRKVLLHYHSFTFCFLSEM